MQFQSLKYAQGNYVRHCWGTTGPQLQESGGRIPYAARIISPYEARALSRRRQA